MSRQRLSWSSLPSVAAAVRLPRYQAQDISPGIVHLGVGNFHRAHQAVAIDDCLAAGETDWGIIGVSFRQSAMRDALAPQDGLFTLLEQGENTRARVIGSLQQILVAAESPAAMIAAIADPRIKLVTLTVTEKGYCLDATRRAPDWQHVDLAHDLRQPEQPRSVAGALVAGLRQRRAQRAGPLTVLSCDNLAGNGDALRGLVQGVAQAFDPSLVSYIQGTSRFPSSMVDRIVPRTTDALRAQAAAMLGLDDQWPVSAEPFTQWIVEDNFAGQRPSLERSGVEFVSDVAPFEAMKLRMLNAAHSTLAYLGVPARLGTVADAIGQPILRGYIERLWRDEVIPSLPSSVRARAPAYGNTLLTRFANPSLGHQLAQIAIDGSQKLPLRIVSTIRLRLKANFLSPLLCLALAAWIRFLHGVDEQGVSYAIDDPLAKRLRPLLTGDAAQRVRQVLGQRDLFDDLIDSAATGNAVIDALKLLERYGTLAALQRL